MASAAESRIIAETKPFLDHSIDSLKNTYNEVPRSSWKTWKYAAVLIHLLLFSTYSLIFTTQFLKLRSQPATSLHPIYNLAIEYLPRTYTDFEISPYAGLPSPSIDKAWHDLLEKTTIRVSNEELAKSNQSSVSLPEGGGYMAWLGVFHELHCVKMLRRWNYREYYHPDVTKNDRPHYDIHADHCLDILRSAAMCHADTTLTTFGWASQSQPMLNTRPIEHKCVNWEALMASIDSRVVGHKEIANLVNPLL